jgi:hypothetical protein
MTNGDNGGALTQELVRTLAHEYDWPDFQPKVHTITKVDPAQYDQVTGSYQLGPNFTLTIMRDGDRLLSQGTAQGPAEIFPEGDHDYFLKVVDARITFETNDRGRVNALILHQNGRDTPAKRLDDAVARPIAEALAAANQRFRDQVPVPNSESTLRRLIGEIAAGTPNYQEITPALAGQIRSQQDAAQALLTKLGPVQSVSFKSVRPSGADVYDVTFANGAAECQVAFQADGKIVSFGFAVTPQ